jgi:hypothetical protein
LFFYYYWLQLATLGLEFLAGRHILDLQREFTAQLLFGDTQHHSGEDVDT